MKKYAYDIGIREWPKHGMKDAIRLYLLQTVAKTLKKNNMLIKDTKEMNMHWQSWHCEICQGAAG